MDTITLIGLGALALLGATCAVLALWCDYQDGVIGHLSLATVATFALLTLLDASEHEYQLLPVTAGVYTAIALFMLRHAIRAWWLRGNSK